MIVVGDQPRPSAEWFCPRCDFPLFWASPPPPDRKPSTQARYRLPGTGGRTVVGAEACWYCGEMNEPGKGECFRCAASIPKPAPPVPMVAPAPQPDAVTVPVALPMPTITWPYVAAGVLAGSAVGIAATSWVLGLG